MSRPRRKRYTVTFTRPGRPVERVVVLGYDAQGIIAWFNSEGKAVLQITAGDYRLSAPADEGGWTVDPVAYQEALTFLGITWPVEIKQTSRQGSRQGAHRLRSVRGEIVHGITVKSYLSAEDAGRVLWHELTHAMQAERAAAGAESSWDKLCAWSDTSEREGSYRTRPLEVEAREYEAMNECTPLARKRRRSA